MLNKIWGVLGKKGDYILGGNEQSAAGPSPEAALGVALALLLFVPLLLKDLGIKLARLSSVAKV